MLLQWYVGVDSGRELDSSQEIDEAGGKMRFLDLLLHRLTSSS